MISFILGIVMICMIVPYVIYGIVISVKSILHKNKERFYEGLLATCAWLFIIAIVILVITDTITIIHPAVLWPL